MRSKTTASLILLGVFALGCVTGAVAYSLYRTHVQASSPRGMSRTGPHDIVGELARGLDLDGEQKEKMEVIISQSRDRYRALSHQFRPQYDAIRDETRQQMRQILREDQKARFDEFMRGIDKRHKDRPRPPR